MTKKQYVFRKLQAGKYEPVVFYDHELGYDDNTVLHCTRRERPQLLIESGEITYLIKATLMGKTHGVSRLN
jgi:hypothetical protein